MKKSLVLFSLFIIIILGSIEFGSAKSYQPLRLKLDYPIRANVIYSLDLNQDMKNEFYACTYGYKSYINAFNENLEIQWNTWVKGRDLISECAQVGENINIIYVDDINSNRDLDIFVGSEVRGSWVNFNIIYYIERELDPLFNVHKQKLRWKYTKVLGVVTDIITADMDNDEIKEIIVSSSDGSVYIFDINGYKQRYELDGTVYDIFTTDIDNDGRIEIIAGTYKDIYLIDGTVKKIYSLNKRISKVYARDLDNDKIAEIIATTEDKIQVINSYGESKWKIDLNEISDITASDIDNDTATEILATVGNDIKAFSPDGSFKWEYPLSDRILSMLLISENELIVTTDKKIYLLETDNSYVKNQSAYKYYEEAKSYYLADNCDDALDLAKKAQKIFIEINNTEGTLRCDSIILHCEGEQAKKELADSYYSEAERYFQEENYKDSRIYAQRAMEIYDELGYNSGIIKCDQFILKIERREYEIKLENAEKYYNEAYWYYTKDDYRNSTLYLEKAKETYTELNNSKGITDCDFLFTEIEKKEKKKAADNFYSLAQRGYKLNEYKDALSSLEQALEIYQELNLSEEIFKCNLLKNLTESHIKANEYYSLADEFYKSEKYENATYHAKEARKIYMELEDYNRVVVCDALLSDIDKKIQERQIFQLGLILSGTIILILSIFLLIKKFKK